MTQNKAQILAQIIIRVKLKTATAEEREVLGSWLDESEENRQLYKNIIRWKCIGERLRLEDEIYKTTNFKQIQQQISKQLVRKNKQPSVRTRFVWISGIAAACLCGVFLWANLQQQTTHQQATSKTTETLHAQLKQKSVMLILEDGQQIDIKNDFADSIKLAQTTLIEKEGRLLYKSNKNNHVQEEITHKIQTCTGGDYSLILSDGTQVWLNSESELEYPIQFIGKERIVKLKGEAYFEVKPDAHKPFIVQTGQMQTRVLGTSFNINAYENENAIYTTLLSGSVEIQVANDSNHENSSAILQPGTQSLWEKGSSNIEIRQIDPANYIAWIYGIFIFDENSLDVVTRVLSRWYNVHFISDGINLKQHTFSGKISKDEKLESILKMLTIAGGPNFKMENNTIHIIE